MATATTLRLNDLCNAFAGIAIGTAVMVLSSKIQVPFWPVPMTLQTLAVVMIALIGGRAIGVASVLGFLGLGVAGLPVFANAGVGFAHLVGPTGGFLAGFLLAAAVIGSLVDAGMTRRWPGTLAAILVGIVTIYASGLLWLSQLIGADRAIALGLQPFLLAEAVKIALALALMQAYRTWLRRHTP
jgi:biotin transport system substrate-specific component